MIIRTCLCIPTFNNEQTIASVVDDCLTLTDFPVLCIDDGSARPVRDALSAAATQALASGRLRIVRHDENRGKGAALQTAFHEAVSRGFTHLLTIDGDGQHLVREAFKLLELAKKHPDDLIIGARKFNSATVPEVSKFGRKFSNFWVNFETGQKVGDSQSGYRLYPLFQVQNMKFFTRRYDFEIEVMIRLLWNGVSVREVEIDVYYPEKEKRVSHFNKLWDNVRISCLNVALVALSLIKTHRAPKATALALGLGVLVGCTPFFGLHTFIVVALAFLLRLNAVTMWLGSQISIPPLAPILAGASLAIGRTIAPERHDALQWLWGSLIFGSVLGSTVAGISLGLSRRFANKARRPATWNGRTRGGVIGNGFLKLVMKYLGIKPAYFCLYFIVPYFYLFAPKARRSANEYWTIARPEAGPIQRQFLVCRQLHKFGQVLMDRVYQSFHKKQVYEANPHGMQHIVGAVSRGQSLIMLSAHVGGWDLAARLLKDGGLPSNFHMVQYQAQGYSFNKVRGNDAEFMKSVASNQTEQQPVFVIREILDKKQPLGLMGDRPLTSQYELVSFFGKLAPFDVTPFRIAAACGAPLVFTFGFKAHDNVYDFYSTGPRVYKHASDRNRALTCFEWAQEYARHLEQMVRKYPEQWFNFYPFWSSLPAAAHDSPTTRAQHHLKEELGKPLAPAPVSAPGPSPSASPRY